MQIKFLLQASNIRGDRTNLTNYPTSAKPIWGVFDIEDRSQRLLPHSVVFDESVELSAPIHMLFVGRSDLESILVSSLSTFNAACGVLASITKWLSQWGQYSSLQYAISVSTHLFIDMLSPHLSSKSLTSFRNARLHFLHMKVRNRHQWRVHPEIRRCLTISERSSSLCQSS